ncbi:MAG TPA: hypothetical protein VIQ30_10505, partial [Pseudonocardia sp.]
MSEPAVRPEVPRNPDSRLDGPPDNRSDSSVTDGLRTSVLGQMLAQVQVLLRRMLQARGVRGTVNGPRVISVEIAAVVAAAWRRSMQLRVVVSTLALSSGVTLVLGLVLETQIADRLVAGKVAAARVQMESAATLLERDLSGVNPDGEDAQGTLNKALDRLTNVTLVDQPGTQNAGEYRAVLTTGQTVGRPESSAGTLSDVPQDLREAVSGGVLAREFRLVDDVPVVIYGQPVRTAGRDLQFYLLFPLTAEQRTLGLVQSTLMVGGLVLILLLVAAAAGAASFTHVHDWTMRNSPDGTGSWFGWANAVISELVPVASMLVMRRRKQTGQPIGYPIFLLGAALILSVTAQLAVAKPT